MWTGFWGVFFAASVLSTIVHTYVWIYICMYAKKQTQRNVNVQTVTINNSVYPLYTP